MRLARAEGWPGTSQAAILPADPNLHEPKPAARITTFAVQALAGLLWLTCLSCHPPADPHRTYERVQGGTMRVGVAEEPLSA
jgi:hypothetical protein